MKLSFRNLAAVSAVAAILATSCDSQEKKHVKQVTFPADATMEQKVEIASNLVPEPKQLAWQDLEMTAFLHFGVNTFTDREWGEGTEDPNVFNPVGLDTDQWVKTLKDAGFKLVMLTAKHHDGFCLWPTATTDHSVKSSAWMNGQGDVVKSLRESCDKYGMKLGLYLSPWDRNAPSYGDSPAYNDLFVAQLTELLSNYGKIDEVWFDGACGEGPNGKKQEYDFVRFHDVIHRLQPDAVVAISGEDVRWVGNEAGQGRETEWSVTPLTPHTIAHSDSINSALDINGMSTDLGSRELIAKADRLYWWPAEVDVSIRPGWFFHDTEQPKSLRELAEIYMRSVGRNAVLLLNIPPNRQGRIEPADSARLIELKQWIDRSFSDNLVEGPAGDLTWKIKPDSEFNTVVLAEDIAKGQRVEKFHIEANIDGTWTKVTEGTTIGKKRILMFPAVKASEIRIVINSTRGKAEIFAPQAYMVEMPQAAGQSITGYVSAPVDSWKAADGSDISALTDKDDATLWTAPAGSREITIDLGKTEDVSGFVYIPRQDGKTDGMAFHYKFFTSMDGKNWAEAKTPGEFSNIVNNPIPQRVYLGSPVKARFVKLEVSDNATGDNGLTAAAFRVLVPQTGGK